METRAEIETNRLFPVFLKLEHLHTLLVGGGNVGLEKLQALLLNSPLAKVTVVASKIREEIQELARGHPACRIVMRDFEEEDLAGMQLVICATDDKELHKRIRRLAKERGILTNVADTPGLCDFYLGSIVQKGNLKIGISTNGKSPTMAKRVKEVISNLIPDEINDTLENLQVIRNRMKGSFAEKIKKLNDLTKDIVSKKEDLT